MIIPIILCLVIRFNGHNDHPLRSSLSVFRQRPPPSPAVRRLQKPTTAAAIVKTRIHARARPLHEHDLPFLEAVQRHPRPTDVLGRHEAVVRDDKVGSGWRRVSLKLRAVVFDVQ